MFVETYKNEVLPKVQSELGIKNSMEVPTIDKIVVQVGIGSLVTKGMKDYSHIENNLRLITGQKPVLRLAKKSVSNFKLREGMPVALSVTLRGQKKFDFLEKLLTIAFPRVRDFRGISNKSFDNQGNFNIGLRETSVFPEIVVEDLNKVHGLQITLSTTAQTKEQGLALLNALNFPFKK
ncbi:MAG: 50S ribosomal protein L5 [Patescibacteria group bacterium]|nr:50S ribosomal protein L5 [Patescibacteria group bacterium]